MRGRDKKTEKIGLTQTSGDDSNQENLKNKRHKVLGDTRQTKNLKDKRREGVCMSAHQRERESKKTERERNREI